MPDFVTLNNAHYGVDVVHLPGDPAHLKCMLFDMKSLWIEQLPIASVVERENKRNPICSYTEALIRSTLLAEQATSYTLQPDGTDEGGGQASARKLTFKYYIASTPVTFEFDLTPGTVDELSECVVVPLWRTVLLLAAKNRALADELTKKDVEIEQYRAEGASLKRTTVQTSKFEGKLFDERFPVRLPATGGLDVLRLVEGREQRERLSQALQVVFGTDGPGESSSPASSSSSSREAAKRSPSSRLGSLKRSPKKWKRQRVDVLCTKIKFPELPDNFNSTTAERLRMQPSDDDA